LAYNCNADINEIKQCPSLKIECNPDDPGKCRIVLTAYIDEPCLDGEWRFYYKSDDDRSWSYIVLFPNINNSDDPCKIYTMTLGNLNYKEYNWYLKCSLAPENFQEGRIKCHNK
jgi:hypothetical protein